jgi:hypothetical protein
MTKEMDVPTANDTGESKTTLSAPTLHVTPRTSPISIGIATLWQGHASIVIVWTECAHHPPRRTRRAIDRKV